MQRESSREIAKKLYAHGIPTRSIASQLGVSDQHLRSEISRWRREEPSEWPARRDGTRCACIVVRMTRAEKSRLSLSAKAAGVTLSVHIRRLVL